jgi:hypothetical protein
MLDLLLTGTQVDNDEKGEHGCDQGCDPHAGSVYPRKRSKTPYNIVA